jgi:hypothetical protein
MLGEVNDDEENKGRALRSPPQENFEHQHFDFLKNMILWISKMFCQSTLGSIPRDESGF